MFLIKKIIILLSYIIKSFLFDTINKDKTFFNIYKKI